MQKYDIVIIGGGPAGLSAGLSAKKAGIDSILILERDSELGGILNQCIHNGFGLHTFKEELTGPEYASRFIEQIIDKDIEYRLDTMVLDISPNRIVTAMNKTEGMFQIRAGAVILAMGCRERPRGALNIPGYRPAGIFSAGTAQRLVNIEGYLPGKEVVILGSGDIGLIMARRMTLEGAKVKVVAEVMPYSGGLKRNIVQCLDDYQIPLKLSHTVVDIEGKDHIEAVTIAEVDSNRKVIQGTEKRYTCDTLLLSVGLIPENELSKNAGIEISSVTNGPIVNESLETSISGIFACGNVLHVHDLVDFVSEEAGKAGESAALYVLKSKETRDDVNENLSNVIVNRTNLTDSESLGDLRTDTIINVKAEEGVRYTVPSKIRSLHVNKFINLRFRVGNVYKNSFVSVYLDNERVIHNKKRILSPGEMEQVIVTKEMLCQKTDLKNITLKIESE